MGQDSKNIKRYRRKVVKLTRDVELLERKCTILESMLEVQDAKLKEFEVEQEIKED